MTKSLTRIGQELQQSLEQFEQLQGKLDQSYHTYLDLLGAAVRRQLVLAVYQICTHYYPEAFLALNGRDRTHVQQHLQQLGYQTQQELLATLERPYDRNPPPQKSARSGRKRLPITPEQLRLLKEKLLQKHDRQDRGDSPDAEALDDQPIVIALDSEQLQSMLSPEPDTEDSEQSQQADNATENASASDELDVPSSLPEMMANLAAIAHKVRERAENAADELEAENAADELESETPDLDPPDVEGPNSELSETDSEETDSEAETPAEPPFEPPCNAVEALRWVQNVEQLIQAALKSLSLQANRTLHKSAILPTQLPRKLFAAALEADEGSNNPTLVPNTMNLVVETDFAPDSDADDSSVVSVTAVRLRLAEVEIAENMVAAARSQLRETLAKMKTLARQYQKLQKDQAMAQAEAAWRATWYEASPTEAIAGETPGHEQGSEPQAQATDTEAESP